MFPAGLQESHEVILDIVKTTFAPFFAGLVLCAILAATTNVMAAQILVVASNMAEDLYKRIFRKEASPFELLWVTRGSVVFIALVGLSSLSSRSRPFFKLVL